jgi:hypothetical protein
MAATPTPPVAPTPPITPAPPVTPAPVTSSTSKFAQMLPNLVYGSIAVLILIVIIWGLSGQGGFLDHLSDRAVARGLITFLITFTTIGIAIILAISTIFAGSGDESDKRFDKGKQVLSVLIGLLGTIVGFYFGSSTDVKPTSPMSEQVLTIAPANISNLQPKKGENFTISSFVSGGKAPYTYSITFDPPVLSAIKDAKSADGIIKQEILVPDTLAADSDIKYEIIVKDNDNKTAIYNKDGALKISLKAK